MPNNNILGAISKFPTAQIPLFTVNNEQITPFTQYLEVAVKYQLHLNLR